MKLLVVTPVRIVVEADEVDFIRAEDATGSFGLCPGHADFVTRLSISVLSWRDKQRRTHHVALREGVLRVTGGTLVEVATTEAEAGDILEDLQDRLVETFRKHDREDEEQRAAANRLHSAAIRQIQRVLRSSREATASQAIPRLQPSDLAQGGEP